MVVDPQSVAGMSFRGAHSDFFKTVEFRATRPCFNYQQLLAADAVDTAFQVQAIVYHHLRALVIKGRQDSTQLVGALAVGASGAR